MDGALGSPAESADDHVERAIGTRGGTVQADTSMESPDCGDVLLYAGGGFETAAAAEPRGVEAQLVSGDRERPDVGEAAVGFEGLVLRGQSLLGGVCPGVEDQPLHLILQVRQRTLNNVKS